MLWVVEDFVDIWMLYFEFFGFVVSGILDVELNQCGFCFMVSYILV